MGAFVVLGLAALASPLGAAAASSPPGPRLAAVELIETRGSERDESTESPFMALTTFGPSGEKFRHLLKQRLDARRALVPFPFYGPSWGADGSSIAFVGARGKVAGIYLADAGGRGARSVPGATRGANPVLSADGAMVAFSRSRTHFPKPRKPGLPTGRFYSSTTTWIIDLESGQARRLTPWRNGLEYVPESFSPDGSLLVLSKADDYDDFDGPQIVLVRMDGGGQAELGVSGDEAVISPDGRRLAFVGYLNPTLVEAEEDRDYVIGELYTMNLDGSGVRRLTRNEDKVESSPSWDPSGQRLAWVEAVADTSFAPGLSLLFPTGNAIRAMNADGTCRQTLLRGHNVASYGVVWQPGAERGAGPIAC